MVNYSIEDSLKFKAYFNHVCVADIIKTFKFNFSEYDSSNAKFYLKDNRFIYDYECYETNQEIDIKIFFEQSVEQKIIKLDFFFLSKVYRNNKQGLVLMARLFNLAHKLKVDQIRLDALSDKDIQAFGGYYWAAMGAEPLVDRPKTIDFSNNSPFVINKRSKEVLEKYKTYLAQIGLVRNAVSEIKTLYDLSQDGRQNPNDENWPGKDFLSNHSWSGGWDLNNPMQMRRSYSVINRRLENLLIAVDKNRNNLFKEKEIVILIAKSKQGEESYLRKEQALLKNYNGKHYLYQPYNTSAVNRNVIHTISRFVKDFLKNDQTYIEDNYPTLVKKYTAVQTIIKSVNQKQKPGSYLHAKITAIEIQQKFGKEILELLVKQQKNQDRER